MDWSDSDLKSITPGPRLIVLNTSQPDLLGESLVALANGEGGQIVVGQGIDEGGPTTLLSTSVEEDLRSAQAKTIPFIPVDWLEEETSKGPLVVLKVEASRHLHSLIDGRIYRRAGSVNRLLLGPELQSMLRQRPSIAAEEQPVFGATADDLDPELIGMFRRRRQLSGPLQAEMPEYEFLQQIGALDQNLCPTICGLLLFGRSPQAFLPFTQVIFVNFKRPLIKSEASSAHRYSRREEITGHIPKVITDTYDLVRQEMDRQSVVQGLARVDRTEYPLSVVREGLVNAVAHRDYTLSGRSIEVRLHDDSLEIISPGGLPAHITLDNMLDEHYSRNPRLVRGLYHWGFIEELGLGIDLMYSELMRLGHPPPEFSATEHRFSVKMYGVRDESVVPEAWLSSMNERQLAAVRHLQKHGSITNREYQELCQAVTPETLRLDLVALVDEGLLLRIGEKRGTRYILKAQRESSG